MKNTKIMAVFVLFLAAALFIGSVSAVAPEAGDLNSTLTFNQTTGFVGVPVEVNLTLTGNAGAADEYALNYTTDGGATITPAGKFTLVSGKNYAAANITVPLPVAGTYTFYVSNMTAPNLGVKYNGTATFTVVDQSSADRTVQAKADAFVYEHIAIDGAPTANKLTKYSEGSNPTAVNQISGSNGVFYLTEAAVNNQYGAYYYTGQPGGSTAVDTFIYIWYPEISLQAELTTNTATGATSGDSIDGKTINKNTQVSFLINSPKVAPAMSASAKIVFTTPAGGKTTTFGSNTANTLANIPLDGTQTIKGGMTIGDAAEAGTWTAQAEYLTAPFNDYAKKSNTVSFTVQSTTLTLTAAKDSVVRSNPFTVTIQGDSQMMYFVYLDGASASDVNPTLQPGQSGMKLNYGGTNSNEVIPAAATNKSVNPLVDNSKTNLQKTWGYFETDASGKRTVQYNTADNTEDKTYTVKVYAVGEKYSDMAPVPGQKYVELNSGADYDSVKVKVEKGSVTIAASGDGSYYIGDEIKLTGTNTDSDLVYLFITGSNLKENGIVLKDLPTQNDAYTASNPISVKTDDTWEYKWDTSKIALDTGAYTVYATSVLTNGKSSYPVGTTNARGTVNDGSYGVDSSYNYVAVKLSDSEYATVSVNLKQPFLSAIPSGTVVAKGDKIYLRGTAEGDPNSLMLYIFGPNKFVSETITVEDDGSYEKKLDIGSDWSSNQYFVVVQHPMYNGVFDAKLNTADANNQFFYIDATNSTGGIQGAQSSFYVTGNNKLQGSNAADALTKMIDSSNIDDIYTKLTFTVAEPMIRVNNPGDQAAGSSFTISGTTNLAVDDQILVEVMSSSFTATDKTSTDVTSGVSQTTKVVAGEGTDNTWSVTVDTTNWKLDEYTIKAAGIEVDVTTTTNFNLVEKVVTPTPTATATGATPTTTTAPATTTPTQTPGFGAFIALAGLGAVALLVLR
ncbi:MAG TPA: PGF-CTERM sorting domain-containing protein, partial [Methanocorpusculum sp.]|nr:PGF-CTERM sorting domain-containing protein [Methanocorpusculum sp.]